MVGQSSSSRAQRERTIRTIMAAHDALLRSAALARGLGHVALADQAEERALRATEMMTRLSARLPASLPRPDPLAGNSGSGGRPWRPTGATDTHTAGRGQALS